MELTVRRVSIILITIGVVTSVVYGTGAFDSMLASRTADVNVAGDATGYVGFHPAEGPNGEYASTESGKLQLQLSKMAKGGGTGVNAGSETTVANVFTIRNQGTAAASIWLDDTSDVVTYERGRSGESLESKAGAVRLKPGEDVSVSVVIDAESVGTGETLRPAMTFHATTAPVNGESAPPTESEGVPPVQTPTTESSTTEEQQSTTPTQDTEDNPLSGENKSTFESIVSFIEKHNGFFKKHQKKLTGATLLTPGIVDDLLLQALLHPQMAYELLVGAVMGGVGVEGGEKPVKEATTIPYFVGWVGGSFVPFFDIFADVRDTIQSALNGDMIGATLGALSAIPAIGKVADVGQVPLQVTKWVGMVGNKASDLISGIKRSASPLSKIPGKAKEKILEVLGHGDTAKKADVISGSELSHYVDKGYSKQRIKQLQDGPFKGPDVRRFIAKTSV